MTLGISMAASGGIVLSTDSRQSYRNRKGISRIGSDNASKLFQLNRRIGIAVAGLAFIVEDEVPKNISKFIEEFKHSEKAAELNVKEAAKSLHEFFSNKYKWQEALDKLPDNIKKDLQNKGCEVLEIKKDKFTIKFRFKTPEGIVQDGIAGVDMINLIVGGYNQDGTYEVYICYIPGEIKKKRDSKEKGKEYGVCWIGQQDVVQRIVLGHDARIRNNKFVKEAIQKYGEEEINKQLRNLEYSIQYGTMALQDGFS